MDDSLRSDFLRFEEAKGREGEKLDSLIFLVGTGTFVLSINFVLNLKDRYLELPLVLVTAWVYLFISIAVHAFAYRYSVKYHQDAIKNIEDALRTQDYSKFFLYSKSSEKQAKNIGKLNDLCLLLLIFGISALLIFAIYNFMSINHN